MNHPFDPTTGLIVVPTRVHGSRGDYLMRLALDTGATSSTLNSALLVLLGYDPASSADSVQVTTGSGVEFAPRLRVQKIEALGKVMLDLPVLCHTLPPSATVDGVLGLDFFRGTILVLDFRAGLIQLYADDGLSVAT